MHLGSMPLACVERGSMSHGAREVAVLATGKELTMSLCSEACVRIDWTDSCSCLACRRACGCADNRCKSSGTRAPGQRTAYSSEPALPALEQSVWTASLYRLRCCCTACRPESFGHSLIRRRQVCYAAADGSSQSVVHCFSHGRQAAWRSCRGACRLCEVPSVTLP